MATKKVQKNTKESADAKSVAKNKVIKSPRVTEKASIVVDKNIYTFDVATDTTKSEIIKMIKAQYKVTPIKVNVAKVPAKAVFRRGKKGMKTGGKKAYVYLKKGDTIEFA